MNVANHDQQRRYARHTVLPQIGRDGQERLLNASVLVVGAGGLGSAALGYLAASGIGQLTIVEHDRVELSNLQRQLLFETGDIGRPKAQAARDRLEELNPDCAIRLVTERLIQDNAHALVHAADAVLDGSDNFTTRFAVAQACADAKKPLISAAISGFYGQLSTFKPYLGAAHPCYRCLVAEAPAVERNCAQEGIIGPLAGVMGSMQALETIKELLGIGDSLSGQLVLFDALAHSWRVLALPADPACPHCSIGA